MKLILAGGGGKDVSQPLDRQMVEWMGAEPTMLYLPFALPNDHRLLPGCESWIASVFQPLGVHRIVTWHARDVLNEPLTDFPLDAFDGIYIGGGNTFRLLHLLRRSHLDTSIVDFATRGKPVYGGSAGAIILGKDIALAGQFGDANDIGSADTAGLDLLRDAEGRSQLVLPHFTAAWHDEANQLAARTGTNVIGIEEDAGLVVEDGIWTTIGAGSVTVVAPK